jgi:hypothetical protein
MNGILPTLLPGETTLFSLTPLLGFSKQLFMWLNITIFTIYIKIWQSQIWQREGLSDGPDKIQLTIFRVLAFIV